MRLAADCEADRPAADGWVLSETLRCGWPRGDVPSWPSGRLRWTQPARHSRRGWWCAQRRLRGWLRPPWLQGVRVLVLVQAVATEDSQRQKKTPKVCCFTRGVVVGWRRERWRMDGFQTSGDAGTAASCQTSGFQRLLRATGGQASRASGRRRLDRAPPSSRPRHRRLCTGCDLLDFWI